MADLHAVTAAELAELRVRLAQYRRELLTALARDFDAGGFLPLLAHVHAAIVAVDAVAAEEQEPPAAISVRVST
ncbi:MAG: hypothetical protein ACREDL_05390 [Bradyrhizobium sp.]